MGLRVNIVGNRDEGKGLAADARLLRYVLKGHDVKDVNHQSHTAPNADLNIFLEVCRPHLHKYAEKNVLIPNCEWYNETAHGSTPYDQIWTKTHHATEYLTVTGRKPEYVGFTTEDVRTTTSRRRKFVHVAGGSRYRNTDVIVDAWKKFYRKGGPEITVISSMLNPEKTPGLTWITRIKSRQSYLQLVNSHLFHLMPSQYEGYGVALWEARCMGNALITTGWPPMNEGPSLTEIEPTDFVERYKSPVPWAIVSPEDVWRAVTRAWLAPTYDVKDAQKTARGAWEGENKAFRKRFLEAVDNLINQKVAV